MPPTGTGAEQKLLSLGRCGTGPVAFLVRLYPPIIMPRTTTTSILTKQHEAGPRFADSPASYADFARKRIVSLSRVLAAFCEVAAHRAAYHAGMRRPTAGGNSGGVSYGLSWSGSWGTISGGLFNGSSGGTTGGGVSGGDCGSILSGSGNPGCVAIFIDSDRQLTCRLLPLPEEPHCPRLPIVAPSRFLPPRPTPRKRNDDVYRATRCPLS